jgi:DNA-binding response OmpR family regulator
MVVQGVTAYHGFVNSNHNLQTQDSSMLSSTQGSPPNRILVVEDDLATRQLSAAVLTASGYHVDTAEDGAAGLEALHRTSYDLLITDNAMPRVSGLELVKQLRFARMTLPVVLASGTIPPEVLDGQPPLQIAATLLKPFTTDELVATVKQVLRAAQAAPD